MKSKTINSLLESIYDITKIEGSGGLFVEITLLIYIFCGFGVMCDKFLIPAIEKIKERYKISERLAGSTILALGGSISLIASNMNAVLLNKVEEIELGLTGILGAAIFELTVGIAIGCFLIKKNYKLAFTTLARDLIIYLIVLVILYYYLEMKYITLNKSIFLVILWVLYMVYLILSAQEDEEDMVLIYIEKDGEDDHNNSYSEASEIIDISSTNVKSESDPYNSVEKSHFILPKNSFMHNKSTLITSNIKKEKFIESLTHDTLFIILIKGFLKILSRPWEMLLNLLTPKSADGIYLFIRFLIPSILIWNVSEIELFILEKVLRRLNISATFLGLTITAWGNNAPDMFNVASAMSKGMVDLAVNAAIASEIHNILLGMGLPWLVYNLKMKKSLNFRSNNLYFFTLFFFSFFILAFIMGLKLNKLRLNNKLAVFLIIVYLIFLVMISIVAFRIS